jgi:pSer/pThr/pTyr-binding forkhead associated (FHA) protein
MAYQSAAYYLIVLEGPGKGTTHAVHGTQMTLGRQADNQIVINDHRVSRHHAQLSWRGTSYVLEDLGSANGTWVNGAKVTNPVTLKPGDTVGLSQDIKLLFSDQPDASDKTYLTPGMAGAGAAGAAYPASAGAMVPQPPSLPTAPPSEGSSSGMMAFGIGGLIALVGALALVAVGAAIYFLSKPASPTSTASVDATALAVLSLTQAANVTLTPYPTATPYPTYTPFPTDAPTATPYPTYTPYPTDAPTATPYPTYTLYPTYTPEPTKEVQNTPKPPPLPPPPQQPTITTAPPATPKPLYNVRTGRNVVYEPWGNPGNPDGCNGPYDDRIEVRRFTVQVLVTNNSKNWIPDHWGPTFISGSGANLPTCIWYYNNTVVEPGETTDVTFATHLAKGDYVRALVFDFPGQTVTICLDPGGNEVPCN